MTERVVIRHLSGAKANQIEQFKLDGLNELMIGRSADAMINFEGTLHDSISRRHGCIRISRRHRQLGFRIIDLDSSNGILVNGRPVMREQALSPDDVVELGAGGPSFRFDVQPSLFHLADPPHPGSRQGTILARAPIPAMPDREALNLVLLDQATVIGDSPGAPGISAHAPVLKPGSRSRFTACLFSAALVGTGAGAFLYRQHSIADVTTARQPVINPAQADPAQAGPVQPAPMQPAVPPTPPIMTTRQIAQKLAGSIVSIKVQWRLYDGFTGTPVFQRILTRRGIRLPCFVELADGHIVPWLSTDDEDHTNDPVGGTVVGNGVVVGRQGTILTSRNVAAAWTAPYDLRAGVRVGALFKLQTGVGRGTASRLIDFDDLRGAVGGRPLFWLPSQGAVLFRSRYPVAIGPVRNNVARSGPEGRNDTMDIVLKPDQGSMAGRLVRLSETSGMAELKIDTDQSLAAAELARGDLKPGDKVTIIGYPAALPRGMGVPEGAQASNGVHSGNVPEATIISGTIATATGEAYRLSVTETPVSGGSPVFDERGRLVALTGSGNAGGDAGPDAYPISSSRQSLQFLLK